MNLRPLPLQKYTDFAVEKFAENGKNVLFSRTEKGGICSVGMIEDAVDFIVRLSSDTYESLLYQMSVK